jgi:hypothetical protein
MRRPTPPDPLVETIMHIVEAERASRDERSEHLVRARDALATARAALEDADEALRSMVTPVVAVMRAGVEQRRSALDRLAARIDAIDLV